MLVVVWSRLSACARDASIARYWSAASDVYKGHAVPAKAAGFFDRGTLEVGRAADIVIYDYENLKVLPCEIVHDLPGNEWRYVNHAEGYRYVIVNGEPIFIDGECTGATPGQLLRHGQAKEAAKVA